MMKLKTPIFPFTDEDGRLDSRTFWFFLSAALIAFGCGLAVGAVS